jgi:hypothetical protein
MAQKGKEIDHIGAARIMDPAFSLNSDKFGIRIGKVLSFVTHWQNGCRRSGAMCFRLLLRNFEFMISSCRTAFIVLMVWAAAPLARGAGLPPQSSWPEWRQNGQRTGHTSVKGDITSPTLSWSYYLGTAVSPTVDDQTEPEPRYDLDGKTAAFEILHNIPAAAKLIREGNTERITFLIQTSAKLGMITIDDYLMMLYRKKLITGETCLEHAQNYNEMRKNLLGPHFDDDEGEGGVLSPL